MKRRLVAFLIIFILVIAAYLAPRAPFIRDSILERVLSIAVSQGIELSYEQAQGSVWSNLELATVKLKGQGLELSSDSLKLTYNLFSLIRRSFIFDLYLSGVSGKLEGKNLLREPLNRSPGPIKILLRKLELHDAKLELQSLPYTLPDFNLDKLAISPTASHYDFQTSLSNSEGKLEAKGKFLLNPFRLDAQVSHADARLARHWWQGVEAGEASGTVSFDSDGFSIDGTVAKGAIRYFQEEASAIEGSFSYHKALVKTQLRANTLGGKAELNGTVDIPARQWFAEAKGKPALADTLNWLSKNWLPQAAARLSAEGHLEASLQAHGWGYIEFSGNSLGSGKILTLPLEAFSSHFSYKTSEGFSLESEAILAKGPVKASFSPQAQGFLFSAQGTDLELLANSHSDATFLLERKAGVLSAAGQLDSALEQFGRSIVSKVETRLLEQGWQFDISAEDDHQARLAAQFLLANTQFSGQAKLAQLKLPHVQESLELVLETAGTLQALPFTITVNAPEQVSLSEPAVTITEKLSGEISGQLSELNQLNNLTINLGPLVASGTAKLRESALNLNYSLATTRLSGKLNGLLSATDGELDIQEGRLQLSAYLSLAELNASVFSLERVTGKLEAAYRTQWSARFLSEQGLSAEFSEGKVKASLVNTPLQAFSEQLDVTANVAFMAAAWQDSLTIDLKALHALGKLELRKETRYLAQLDLAEGMIFGSYDPSNKNLELSATLANLPLSASGQASLEALDLDLRIADSLLGYLSGPVSDPNLSLKGILDIQNLADYFGLPLQGMLSTDLKLSRAGLKGQAKLSGQLADIPLTLNASANGFEAGLEGTFSLYGTEALLSGQLYPLLQLRASSSYGELSALQTEGDISLNGSGSSPALTALGWQLDAQNWSLEGSVAQRSMALYLGQSTAQLRLNPAGWELDAQIQQSLQAAEKQLRLIGKWQASNHLPMGQLLAKLYLQDASGETAFDLQGSPEALKLTGNLSAYQAASLAGFELPLNGQLELTAVLNALTQSYQAKAQWHVAEAESLELELSGQAKDLSAKLSSDKLKLSYHHSSFELVADGFSAKAFINANYPDVSVSGELYHSASAQWQGSLNLVSEQNSPGFSAGLRGQASELILSANARVSGLSADVVGPILPELNVSISSELAGYGKLSGTVSGSLLAPQLQAVLTSPGLALSQPRIVLPEQNLYLSSNLSLEHGLHIDSPVLKARVSSSGWQGELTLPFELEAERHLLSGSISGDLANPQFIGKLSGALAEGSFTLSQAGLESRLELNPKPLLAAFASDYLEPISETSATLTVHAKADLQWQASIEARALYASLPLGLSVSGNGQGRDFLVSGNARIAEQNLPLSFSSSRDASRLVITLASFDVAALNSLISLPAAGMISGTVNWNSANFHPLGAKLSFQGELARVPLSLDLEYQHGRLASQLKLADGSASIHSQDLQNFSFSALSSYPNVSGQLSGTLNLAETWSLDASGNLVGEQLELSAWFDPQNQQASWHGTIKDASLKGQFDGRENVLSTELSKPPGSFGTFPLELSARFRGEHGWALEELWATSVVAEQELRLSASGAAYPRLELSGLVQLADWHFPLKAFKDTEGYQAQLNYQDLVLSAAFTPGLNFQALKLGGKLDWNQGFTADLATDLAWSPAEGFWGSAQLAAQAPNWQASMAISAQGSVSLTGTATFLETLHAQVQASLAKNPFEALEGKLRLSGDLQRLIPAELAGRLKLDDGLALFAELELMGDVSKPSLLGPVKLEGALSAAGQLSATSREAQLGLSGPSLDITAVANRQGWQLELVAREQDLAPLLAIEALSLNASILAQQDWAKPLALKLTELELKTQLSQLSGELSFEAGWQGQLNADIALEDIDSRLKGQLSGEVFVNSSPNPGPNINARLQLDAIGLADNQAFLTGSGIVNGSWLQPSITLRLNGGGGASGQILALLEPAQSRYSLSSNLNWGAFHSDLDLRADRELWQARGNLGYQHFSFAVDDPKTDSLLEFRGQGALQDWRLALDLVSKTLAVDGDMASLNPALTGKVKLAADWSEDAGEALSASIDTLTFLQQPLGTAKLSLARWQAGQLIVSGTTLQGSIKLSPFSWQLEQLSMPIGKSSSLIGQGSGQFEKGELKLLLNASIAGESDQLSLLLGYQSGELYLQSDDDFLGGHVSLDAKTSAGLWQGELRLLTLKLLATELSLDATLSGSMLSPQLEALSQLDVAGNSMQGSFRASLKQLDFEQELQTTLLSSPLFIQGSLGESSELNLRQNGDSLSLSLAEQELLARGRLELETSQALIRVGANEADQLELALIAKAYPELSLALVLSEKLTLNRLTEGLSFAVQAPSSGTLFLKGQSLEAQALSWQTAYGSLGLDGQLSRVKGTWQADAKGLISLNTPLEQYLAWLPSLAEQSFQLQVNDSQLSLSGQGTNSQVFLNADLANRNLNAQLQLNSAEGILSADVAFDPLTGPSGTLSSQDLGIIIPGGRIKLSIDSKLDPEFLSLTGTASLGESLLYVSGELGLASLVPQTLAPQGSQSRNLNARLGLLDVQAIPWIHSFLPNLQGNLSATANLRQNQLIAQLVSPDLRVEDNNLPLNLSLTGSLQDLELTGNLAKSRLTGNLGFERFEGLLLLEQFPLEAPAEAWFGDTDVRAELTGVLRFDLPYQNLKDSDIRFASEQISLERADVITKGNLSFAYINRRFTLNPTTFSGIGTWQAGGVIAEDELNLNFSAVAADFSPLLGLIPPLNPYEPEAFGSLNLEARGSLSQPLIQVSSPNFAIKLAGSTFELNNAFVQVSNQSFSYQSKLSAVSPISGSLDVSGEGRVGFIPDFDASLSFLATGSVLIPTLGQVDDLSLKLSYSPQESWQLSSQGLLGNPFNLEGSLRPLDLRLTGSRLNVRAPQYFLNSSETDLDLSFSYEDRHIVIRGKANTSKASLSNETRVPRQAVKRPRPRVLSLIVFDDVAIDAPKDLVFTAAVGTAELGLGVVISGSAAAPQISGEAKSLRGSFRFAGRSFSLEEGIASFQASRGIYPTLNLRANSSFDKSSVSRGTNISFIEPAGSSFEVILSLTGEVIPVSAGNRSYRIDLEPQLSSNVILQLNGAVRTLSENELYSLLTLGRIETSNTLTGTGSVAESVTQGAIDTAIDTFLLAELQNQVATALGLDSVEIRTSSLSSLITGSESSFGVALRLGSYLSNEVFASYEISNLSSDPDIVLSNAFSLRYQLSPLELGLSGRLKLLDDPQLRTIPELGISVAYAFNPLIRLELGAELSNASQRFSFGVSFRW